MNAPPVVPAGHRLTTLKGSMHFVVEDRFQPLHAIGCGAYGVVCAATTAGQAELVAIKKMTGIFDDQMGSLGEAKRAMREILLLRYLQHENLLSLRHMMLPPPGRDVYLVTDLMDSDLSKVIASREPLSDDHVCFFLYQLLCGVQHLHDFVNVVHRDLKPSNLLINKDCELRIADFGLARSLDEPCDHDDAADITNAAADATADSEGAARAPRSSRASSQLEPPAMMTQYVVTRWYRAPELLILSSRYHQAVDVWSVGCILAELLSFRILFPGRDFLHQLELITQLVGSPPVEELADAHSRLRPLIAKWAGRPRKPLATALPCAPADAVSLLNQLLCFRPEQRLSAREALAHEYLAEFAEGGDEDDEQGGSAGGVDGGGAASCAEMAARAHNPVRKLGASDEIRRTLCYVEDGRLNWSTLKEMLQREARYWARASGDSVISSPPPVAATSSAELMPPPPPVPTHSQASVGASISNMSLSEPIAEPNSEPSSVPGPNRAAQGPPGADADGRGKRRSSEVEDEDLASPLHMRKRASSATD